VEVVLDVNVFVSAVLSGASPSAHLVAAMRAGRLSVVACPGPLAELGDVLRRERFRRFLSVEEAEQYAAEIEGMCRMVDEPQAFRRCFATLMTTTSWPSPTNLMGIAKSSA